MLCSSTHEPSLSRSAHNEMIDIQQLIDRCFEAGADPSTLMVQVRQKRTKLELHLVYVKM